MVLFNRGAVQFAAGAALPKTSAVAGHALSDPLPLVSVVIAARDEAARIEPTVRRLFAQVGVPLEVIVVDDRSTDATPEILARLSAEFPQLRALRVDRLPARWLGKCHACWLGAEAATGGWILFTDGDIHMTPDLIHRAVAQALADGVDHICLWPTLNCASAATRGVMLAWAQCIALYASPWKINRDRHGRPAGIGAFNLVRTAAYRACGGYESLRLEVVDDMRLGLLLQRAGFRQRLYNGVPDLEADWCIAGRRDPGVGEELVRRGPVQLVDGGRVDSRAERRLARRRVGALACPRHWVVGAGGIVFADRSGHRANAAGRLGMATLAVRSAGNVVVRLHGHSFHVQDVAAGRNFLARDFLFAGRAPLRHAPLSRQGVGILEKAAKPLRTRGV